MNPTYQKDYDCVKIDCTAIDCPVHGDEEE